MAAAPALDDASPEEQLEYKREFAIRQREEQMKQKQDEELERKKHILDEKKRREERAKNERTKEQADNYSKSQLKKRAAEMENDFRQKCREANITKKRSEWLQKENQRMQDMIADYYADEEELNERLLEAKERKTLMKRQELERKIFMMNEQKRRDNQREMKERERREARKEREIRRIDELKLELDQEVDQYIEQPTHVPLKQALCGGLRPVPTVTQLLATARDMEEDLKDVKETILEERAKALKKPLFTYVQELKAMHARTRLKPPEPEIDEKRARKQQANSANTTKGSSTGFGHRGSSTGFGRKR